MLASEQRACAGIRCTGEQLERRFFIGRPFNMHVFGGTRLHALRDGFDKLARGRARITRDHGNARLKRGMREGLVAHEQFLRHYSAIFALKSEIFLRHSSQPVPSICTARMAAFFAPLMATHATGTPEGI